METTSSLFGQIHIRKNPEFYLCTRYLVMHLATGAVHFFRFKGMDKVGQFYPDLCNIHALEMSRQDTNGYLLWYLNFVWAQTGHVRTRHATLKEDLITCYQYW